jgi:hypothetical protein
VLTLDGLLFLGTIVDSESVLGVPSPIATVIAFAVIAVIVVLAVMVIVPVLSISAIVVSDLNNHSHDNDSGILTME